MTRRWTSIPAQRSSAPLLKLRLYAVLGVLVFAGLSGILALFVALGNRAEPVVPTVPRPEPRAQAEASIVAREWIAGQPVSVPVAKDVVVADQAAGERLAGSADRIAWASYEPRNVSGQCVEFHRFLVTSVGPAEAKQPYWLYVPMRVPAGITGPAAQIANSNALCTVPATGSVASAQYPLQAVLAGSPMLVRATVPTEDGRGQRLAQGPDQGADKVLTKQLRAWVDAYLAGDAAQLPGLSGNTELVFAGLDKAAGFTLVGEPEIVSVVPCVGHSWFAAANGCTKADKLVTLSFTTKSASGWAGPMQLDLFVHQEPGSVPQIQAWGPAGDGPRLLKYQNALNGAK